MVHLDFNDHGLQPFHDQPAIHTHKKCFHCFAFSRDHHGSEKLLRCAGCGTTFYCSKECQKSDWSRHKIECKAHQIEADRFGSASGIPTAYNDMLQWMDYYDPVMKNCALAAYRNFRQDHAEKTHLLYVSILHNGNTKVPAHRRFDVVTIRLEERNHPNIIGGDGLDESFFKMGKMEFGKNFYGVGTYYLVAGFRMHPIPVATFRYKSFSYDKRYATMNITRPDWWMLMREYVNAGAKMHFLCGKLEVPGMEDVTCKSDNLKDPKSLDEYRELYHKRSQGEKKTKDSKDKA